MACGEPSPSFMKQLQLAVCQLCGRDMASSHEAKVNYQKQVDEPRPPYKQIIPDYRYDEQEAELKRKKGGKDEDSKKIPFQVFVQFANPCSPQAPASCSAAPPPPATPEPKPKEECPAKKAENSASVKAACLPNGGGCPPPVKMMLCLPCPAPDAIAGTSGGSGGCGGGGSGGYGGYGGSQSAQRKKPRDYTYRCESRELRGGNLYCCCQCIKRNGLQHDCPRTPCQGRPACLVKPWPDCWPSGGCHGIDYSRENGVKRYDPCMEQRFDKKECRPNGGSSSSSSSSAKPDCGGNMMIVVCPAPQTC